MSGGGEGIAVRMAVLERDERHMAVPEEVAGRQVDDLEVFHEPRAVCSLSGSWTAQNEDDAAPVGGSSCLARCVSKPALDVAPRAHAAIDGG